MDLGAYTQIDDINKIAKDNGIDVPRLRGYRLMKDEKSVSMSEIIDRKEIAAHCVEDLCESKPFWKPYSCFYSFSIWTNYLKKYYLIEDKDGYIDVRWDRIHGKKRKILKTFIHNEIKRKTRQWEVWNKYAGRDDILYIHARIGGDNWNYYHKYVDNQPWFLEKVDDSFDDTYCDIYAKINPVVDDIKAEQNKL